MRERHSDALPQYFLDQMISGFEMAIKTPCLGFAFLAADCLLVVPPRAPLILLCSEGHIRCHFSCSRWQNGAVAELVGIWCGVVSGVFNLESSGLEVPDWRPRHDKHYQEAFFFAANGGDGC
jgi:hypothetical protein